VKPGTQKYRYVAMTDFASLKVSLTATQRSAIFSDLGRGQLYWFRRWLYYRGKRKSAVRPFDK